MRNSQKFPLAQPFVEHSAGYFGIPVIKPGEEAKDDGPYQHIMKVRHDEVRVVQLPVPGG